MAEKEYIEREELIRYTEKQEVIIKDGTSIADAMRIQGNVFRRCVETCPTADVASKSESEFDSIPVEAAEALKEKAVEKAKAEAVKEFADRLKEKLIANGIYPVLVKNSMDKILKEMGAQRDDA